MNSELVLVLDFGGQYNQLIARRVRECNVYAEVIPYTTSLEDIKAKNPKGIIFTGGPNSVYKEDSPSYDKSIFEIFINKGEKVFSGRVFPREDQTGIAITKGNPTGTYYELDYGRKAN